MKALCGAPKAGQRPVRPDSWGSTRLNLTTKDLNRRKGQGREGKGGFDCWGPLRLGAWHAWCIVTCIGNWCDIFSCAWYCTCFTDCEVIHFHHSDCLACLVCCFTADFSGMSSRISAYGVDVSTISGLVPFPTSLLKAGEVVCSHRSSPVPCFLLLRCIGGFACESQGSISVFHLIMYHLLVYKTH